MMWVDFMLRTRRRGVRARVARILLAVAGALAVSFPPVAVAQTSTACGPSVKEDVVKALDEAHDKTEADKVAVEEALYSQYQSCAQDAALVPSTFHAAANQCGATVSHLGSLFYEEMSCCGYDPQRRQFACPVKIKQSFGFGGAPLPGSREYVLHCVADNAGNLVPVGHDSVHLADAPGRPPTWQFAVIANANDNLHTVYPMNGLPRKARSILSWGLRPTHCEYRPIWGNALNYNIRLDQ